AVAELRNSASGNRRVRVGACAVCQPVDDLYVLDGSHLISDSKVPILGLAYRDVGRCPREIIGESAIGRKNPPRHELLGWRSTQRIIGDRTVDQAETPEQKEQH